MATTAWTLLKSTTGPPPSRWLAPITPLNYGVKPPQASNVYPQACLSPTSTQPLVVHQTLVCMSMAGASSWAQAAAPSSCVSASYNSVPLSATRVPSWTLSATAVPAATHTLTRTARPQHRPRHTTRTRPRKTQTWHDPCRSACRLTCDNVYKWCREADQAHKLSFSYSFCLCNVIIRTSYNAALVKSLCLRLQMQTSQISWTEKKYLQCSTSEKCLGYCTERQNRMKPCWQKWQNTTNVWTSRS